MRNLPAALQPPTVVATLAHATLSEGLGLMYFAASNEDAHLEDAISWVAGHLVPCGEENAMVGLDYVVRLLSCKRPDADIMKGYAAILGDMPEDLLSLALRATCAAATYHKLPPPGVFVRAVEDEWSRRKSDLSRLVRHRERIRLANRTRSHRAGAVEAAPSRPALLLVPQLRAE